MFFVLFFVLLHSSLLPLLPVFFTSHCNRQKCLLYSVKPSTYFFPFKSFFSYMYPFSLLSGIFIALYHILMSSNKNQISFLPQIPSSQYFTSVTAIISYRKIWYKTSFQFRCFQLVRKKHVIVGKASSLSEKFPILLTMCSYLMGILTSALQGAMGMKCEIIHGKYLVQWPQQTFLPLSLSSSLSYTKRQSLLLVLSPVFARIILQY